ncbi:DUF551 domain-containing protein [Burkholderia gladioli]|uniref:DUF551 domain-containing protein n=1 Tax=Burkholderia gladioli TaxID=28095 RepID=UPI00163F072E|nr:DUF551 domain-containing protein [Burkholderia gladioli]
MSDKLSDDERARLDAEVRLDYEMSAKWPFDASDAWWNDDSRYVAPPAVDSAHAAARAIIRDLSDRGGIKRGFENIDEETRVEIVKKLAAIIRAASPAPAIPADPMSDQQILDIAKRVTPAFRESPASCIALVRAALKAAPAISESEDTARWIATSDRLPSSAEEVLVAVEFFEPGDWRIKVGYLGEQGGWHVFGGSWTPTHWMPLPASPVDAARKGEKS